MLTPEQAQDLVDHFGNQRAAARATGLARSTLQRCLDPTLRERERLYVNEMRANNTERAERHRAAARKKYANDPDYRERRLSLKREQYYNLSGVEYNRLLLRSRRWHAVKRMEQRTNKED